MGRRKISRSSRNSPTWRCRTRDTSTRTTRSPGGCSGPAAPPALRRCLAPGPGRTAIRVGHERPQKRISGTVGSRTAVRLDPLGDDPLAGHRLRVSFVGLGYVGLCTAVAFANRGFDTLGVDVDPERLALVEVGRAPIHEPRLERLLKTAVVSGRLRVSDDLAEVAATDVVFLTVGTPSALDGSIDTRHV